MPGSHLLGRLRTQLAELGGTVIDVVRQANGRRLLDEQVHEVDEEIRRLRREIDTLKAQRFTTQERLDAAAAKILQREAQAVAALQAGRQDLAREIAAAIVELERERSAEQGLLVQNEARSAELMAQLHRGENLLRRLRHELDLLRAAEAVASAEEAFSQRTPGDALGIPTAIDSAELLKSRQAASTQDPAGPAGADAAAESLDDKLRAAGLAETKSPVDVVLERIAAQAALASRPEPRARKGNARSKDMP